MFMKEAEIVMRTILEIMNRNYNGYAKIKMGALVADSEKFRKIFNLLTRNTQLNNLDLILDIQEPEIECSCGYKGKGITHLGLRNARCPVCNRNAKIVKGFEFEIIEPKEHN